MERFLRQSRGVSTRGSQKTTITSKGQPTWLGAHLTANILLPSGWTGGASSSGAGPSEGAEEAAASPTAASAISFAPAPRGISDDIVKEKLRCLEERDADYSLLEQHLGQPRSLQRKQGKKATLRDEVVQASQGAGAELALTIDAQNITHRLQALQKEEPQREKETNLVVRGASQAETRQVSIAAEDDVEALDNAEIAPKFTSSKWASVPHGFLWIEADPSGGAEMSLAPLIVRCKMYIQALGVDTLEVAGCYFKIGSILISMGRFKDALDPLHSSEAIYESIFGQYHQYTIQATSMLGQAYHRIAILIGEQDNETVPSFEMVVQLKKALQLYRRAWGVMEFLGGQIVSERIFITTQSGKVESMLGNHKAAAANFSIAIREMGDSYDRPGQDVGMVSVMLQEIACAELESPSGEMNVRESVAKLEKALDLRERLRLPPAGVFCCLGAAMALDGDWTRARQQLRRSLDSSGYPLVETPVAATAFYDLGIICLRLEETDEAATHFEETKRILEYALKARRGCVPMGIVEEMIKNIELAMKNKRRLPGLVGSARFVLRPWTERDLVTDESGVEILESPFYQEDPFDPEPEELEVESGLLAKVRQMIA